MTQDRAVEESIRIAKLQVRADKGLIQRFVRPVDHLWEVVKRKADFALVTNSRSSVLISTTGPPFFSSTESKNNLGVTGRAPFSAQEWLRW